MGKKSQTGRQLQARLFLAVCFLILLVLSLIKGEFILAAAGVIGLVCAFESYRWYKRRAESSAKEESPVS
jgi:succinate-acetate transporter protein